ncbi:hypothetical protein [Microbispora triticiradicis]|uniref:hypothetical protein n=1 Tax=Microbispora triticiradicis TaxID=2200763 RepID=UPI003A5BFC30
MRLLRPSYRNRTPRPGEQHLKPIRQLIESVNDTLKGQLDLELHGGRSPLGVAARVAQRILALTAAIWHNRATSQPITRSLIAYDHWPDFGLTRLGGIALGGRAAHRPPITAWSAGAGYRFASALVLRSEAPEPRVAQARQSSW